MIIEMTREEFEEYVKDQVIIGVTWNEEYDDGSLCIYQLKLKNGVTLNFMGSGQIGVDSVDVYVDDEE